MTLSFTGFFCITVNIDAYMSQIKRRLQLRNYVMYFICYTLPTTISDRVRDVFRDTL